MSGQRPAHPDDSGSQCSNLKLPISIDVPSWRARFIGLINGTRYSFAGAGDNGNDWSIPAHAFTIQEVVGQHLLVLGNCDDGLCLQYETHRLSGRRVEIRTQHPVAALVSPEGNLRSSGSLFSVMDHLGFIRVVFGPHRHQEEGTDRELIDLSEIPTPSTPSSASGGS